MNLFKERNFFWIREPRSYEVTEESLTIITEPDTDMWQRTYHDFQADNAPAYVCKTSEPDFSFVVKTKFDSKYNFDQCGIVVYLDSDNWVKASIEYENEEFQRLGSVVTNHGYSDWASTDIDTSIKEMWYRLTRRKSDFCLECSTNGVNFKQMRVFHMFEAAGEIEVGLYACSPDNSTFKAEFTDIQITAGA